jgi:hypothetical protein
MKSAEQNELDAPPSPSLRWMRWLYLLFLFSFVFDYRSPDLAFDAEETGGSVFQFAFLGLALFSGGLLVMSGWRYLLVRPGVYLILLWFLYIAFMLGVALLHGNEPGRILRLLLSPVLLGLSIASTHIVACAGMRPGQAVRYFLVAGVISVIWNFSFGLFGYGQTLADVRMEILSPAIRFLFAWVGCSLLLRRDFSTWTFVILFIPLVPTVFSVTRSIAFPIAAAAVGSAFCLVLGLYWRLYSARHPLKKLAPLAGIAVAGVGCVALLAMIQPETLERWTDRLFHNSGDGATTEDLSSLMRKAEAKSMLDILSEEPATFLYGRGPGAWYYWDESYYPELFQVYPEDRHQFADKIYTAGHSIWTYTLFSSGIIGILVTLGMFFATMYLSLRASWLNSTTVMGRWSWDAHLMFLPFVAMLCVLSESITRNPFDERFTGVLFGFMAALPQFFHNRAFYLRHREQQAAVAPQIILHEEDLPSNWEGSSPSRA